MDSGVSRLGVDYILISQSLPRLLFHQLAGMEDKKHVATFNMSLSQTGAVNTDMLHVSRLKHNIMGLKAKGIIIT